jgi:hypothetical protein
MKTRLVPVVLALGVTAAVVAGCGQDHTAGAVRTPAVAAAPSPSKPGLAPTKAATAAEPVVARITWSNGPITVTHTPAVPPVPVVTGIRYAGHPQDGYDRIVLDIQGGLPGYSAKYVTQVRADGSDKPISVPGNRFLLIVLNPAQAHTDSGAVTVSGVHNVGLPMLRAYAIAGDYEGHVSIALGLSAKAVYRVGELPGRIYIDVAT